MGMALAMPVATASAHGIVEEKFISYDADKDEMKTYDSQEAMYRALGIKPRPAYKPRFGRRHVRHWMEVDEEKDAYPVLSPDGKMEAYRQCWHLKTASILRRYGSCLCILLDSYSMFFR